MSIKITAKNFDLTESIQQVTIEKLQKFTSKIDKGTEIRVRFEVDKEAQKAKALFYVGGSLIKVEAIDKDLYVAIDKLVDKMNYQTNKMIEKSHERKNDSIRFIEPIKEREGKEIMNENKPIVKRKQFELKPMMEEEAILQMEMLKHDFFFFFNGETETTCLLYKRKDGNYGLIENTYN